jgi:hypothetical protein
VVFLQAKCAFSILVSSLDSTFDLFFSLTVCGVFAVTVADVRVYLVGYILYNRLLYMLGYI